MEEELWPGSDRGYGGDATQRCKKDFTRVTTAARPFRITASRPTKASSSILKKKKFKFRCDFS